MPRMPVVSAKKFWKLVERLGCTFDGVDGDHYINRRLDLKRPLVIPMWKELPVFIVLNNLRTLRISRDEFIKLIREI